MLRQQHSDRTARAYTHLAVAKGARVIRLVGQLFASFFA